MKNNQKFIDLLNWGGVELGVNLFKIGCVIFMVVVINMDFDQFVSIKVNVNFFENIVGEIVFGD